MLHNGQPAGVFLLAVVYQLFTVKLQEEIKQAVHRGNYGHDSLGCVIILGNAKVCVHGPQEEKRQNKCALGQRDSSSLSRKESQLLRVKSVSYASKIFKCSLLSHR